VHVRECAVPITPFLQGQAFTPERIQVMSDVLVRACNRLGILDRTDRVTEQVAEKIIWFAQNGVLEPEALLKRTLEAFNVHD
jgi:hypothetical protein